MTALQKIDVWLDDIKKDLESKGVAGYAGQFVYDKLKEIQADMQTEALKNTPIPPHPLPAAKEPANPAIRDRIACMAMGGFISATPAALSPTCVAMASYEFADAMIKEGKIQV